MRQKNYNLIKQLNIGLFKSLQFNQVNQYKIEYQAIKFK